VDPSPPGHDRLGRRFVVSGRVQGVGYRYFVLRRAQALGLAGWVRNLPGGEVEVRAWGVEGDLAQLADQLRMGPRSAKVTKVETFEISDAGKEGTGFRITG
jgi:acylphosphatase